MRDFFRRLAMLESYRLEQETIMRAELYKSMEPGGENEGLFIDPEIIVTRWRVGML